MSLSEGVYIRMENWRFFDYSQRDTEQFLGTHWYVMAPTFYEINQTFLIDCIILFTKKKRILCSFLNFFKAVQGSIA